jgi:Tfp pilus assembly protein PilE
MKVMSIIVVIAIVLFTLFAYMSYASNKKVERQKYDLVKNENGFEIRFYPKAIMASVSSVKNGNEKDANQNFRRLAGYIFGGNKEDQKIAMTAPVYMERDAAANKMSFVLPSGYNMNDLPHPNDSNITLHYSDEGHYAALRFGGFASDDKIAKKENELKELLKNSGYEVVGNFNYLGYNAPWDVINRENEIIVKIKYNEVK